MQDKENSHISVLIPAYNEEGNIEELCHQFDEMTRKSDYSFELVLIDDGSTDRTYNIIREMNKRYDFIRIAHHSVNRGLTDALMTGFETATGNIFVFYPADLQYRPEDIPALVEPIVERDVDVVAGWKQGKYSKKFVSSVYNLISRKIFGLKIHDMNSVKAFKADVVKDMFLRKDWHRYLIVLAADKGHRIDEVKMPLYERAWGASKFSSIWRIPVGVLDMLAVKTQLTFLKKPLLFFGLLGSIFVLLGIVVGLIAIYLRYFEGVGFRPMLYLVILLIGMGMGMFILGFLAEGMASQKEELAAIRRKLDEIQR